MSRPRDALYVGDELDAMAEELDDELEEAMGNCSQFCDGGRIVCGAVGSEDCDECPFHGDLGQPCNPGLHGRDE